MRATKIVGPVQAVIARTQAPANEPGEIAVPYQTLVLRPDGFIKGAIRI